MAQVLKTYKLRTQNSGKGNLTMCYYYYYYSGKQELKAGIYTLRLVKQEIQPKKWGEQC